MRCVVEKDQKDNLFTLSFFGMAKFFLSLEIGLNLQLMAKAMRQSNFLPFFPQEKCYQQYILNPDHFSNDF